MNKSAIEMIQEERDRQVQDLGYDDEHDDEHTHGEIAALAAAYAMPNVVRGWSAESTGYGDTWAEAIIPDGRKPTFGNRFQDLVKAGALIIAEIERLQRAETKE